MNKKIKIEEKSNLYSGNVKISFINEGSVYKVIEKHNTGTKELFKYMLGYLSGSFDPVRRPGLIIPYDGDKAIIPYGVQYDNISKPVENSSDGSCYIVYKFLLPNTLIIGSKISKYKLASMYSRDIIYAEVELDSEIEIPSDTNILVEWTLSLSN